MNQDDQPRITGRASGVQKALWTLTDDVVNLTWNGNHQAAHHALEAQRRLWMRIQKLREKRNERQA